MGVGGVGWGGGGGAKERESAGRQEDNGGSAAQRRTVTSTGTGAVTQRDDRKPHGGNVESMSLEGGRGRAQAYGLAGPGLGGTWRGGGRAKGIVESLERRGLTRGAAEGAAARGARQEWR